MREDFDTVDRRDPPEAGIPPGETAESPNLGLDEESGKEAPALAAESRPSEEILRSIERLTKEVERQTALRERDQEVAERLHRENERLRRGEVREVQRPLVADLARLVDLVTREADEAEQGRTSFDFLRDGLIEVLASAGVLELVAEPGEPFERGRHKAVEKVPTTDEAQSGLIAEIKRIGFGWTDGAVLRFADVAVFVFEPNDTEPEAPSESPDDPNETEREEVK